MIREVRKMAKRGENIYKRKDKRWEGRYKKGYGPNHKIMYGYVYGKTYTEVKEKMKKIQQESPFLANCNFPFEQMCRLWLEKKRILIKTSTYSKYVSIVNQYLIPEFGKHKMTQITCREVNTFITKLASSEWKALSSKTIRDIYMVLHNILIFAKEEYQCPLPAGKITLPKKTDQELDILTEQEHQALSGYLLRHTDEYRNIGILLSLHLGIRIGEICSLQWSDIDFQSSTIFIRKTLQRIQNVESRADGKTKVIIDAPKSSKSIREIPIPDFLLPVLKKASQGLPKEAFLLTGKTDLFVEPRNLQYHFKKCREMLSIAPIKFHALRHTFASRCVENGCDIKTLSEILGHTNTNITLKYYVHISMDIKRKQINALFPSASCGELELS